MRALRILMTTITGKKRSNAKMPKDADEDLLSFPECFWWFNIVW